jgi:hypothetical protein
VRPRRGARSHAGHGDARAWGAEATGCEGAGPGEPPGGVDKLPGAGELPGARANRRGGTGKPPGGASEPPSAAGGADAGPRDEAIGGARRGLQGARREEERGGGREREREGERGRGQGRGEELTSGSKFGDHHLQNLGHHGRERWERERELCTGELNEGKRGKGRGRAHGGGKGLGRKGTRARAS